MRTLWQDLRYGLRMLWKSPAFTAVAVISLALGIGVNMSIFTIFDAFALRPLRAVSDPDSLVRVYTSVPHGPRYEKSSYPNYVDYRDYNEVFSGLIACARVTLYLSGGPASGEHSMAGADTGERIEGDLVSGNFFSVLGVKPVIGRTFLPEEDQTPGAHPLVVISRNLWQRRFGSDPNLLGKTLTLNGHPFTVVGVAPKEFHGAEPEGPDLWVPLMMQTQVVPGRDLLNDRRGHWFKLWGRLKPGVTLEQAQAAMAILDYQLEQAYPDTNSGTRVTLTPASSLNPGNRAQVISVMVLILAAVGFVSLIACANVANLLLARASVRQKEIGVRLALGATRRRLVQQLLTESLLIALLSGAVGLLLALWVPELIVAVLRPPDQPPILLNLSPDFRVFGYTLLLSLLLTGLIFGLLPALQASKPNLLSILKDEGTAFNPRFRRSRLRSLLVVGQVALSLILLIGAGLFTRSLQRAQTIDLGFETKNLLVLSLDLRLHGYDETRTMIFHRQLLDRLETLPGVRSVSLSRNVPASDTFLSEELTLEGREPRPNQRALIINSDIVSRKYFETLGIPIVRGRPFTEEDTKEMSGVVIINEAMTRRFWPGEDPIGKRLRAGGPGSPWLQVIGVAKDTRNWAWWETPPQPHLYHPMAPANPAEMRFLVRTEGNPKRMMGALRGEVRTLDGNLGVSVRTLNETMALSMWPARVGAMLSGALALLALLLAAVGIYGVMAYAVSQRTHEIGIRLALGAQPHNVLKLVLGQGLALIAVGVTLGLAGSWAVTRLLSNLLFGLSAVDPVTFGSVSLLLTAVALLACYIPARQALKVDPVVALRHE